MQDSIPLFKLILLEWETYCILADRPASKQYSRFSKKRNFEVWEDVDKSFPIPLGNDTWFVRIRDHKIKGLHLDIRRFELHSDGDKEWFIPSENGLCVPLAYIGRILDPVIKLLKKWKGK